MNAMTLARVGLDNNRSDLSVYFIAFGRKSVSQVVRSSVKR